MLLVVVAMWVCGMRHWLERADWRRRPGVRVIQKSWNIHYVLLNKRGVVDSASDVERACNRPANSTVDYQAENAIEDELKDLDLAGWVLRAVCPLKSKK
jgi:hypothetical protein